MSILYAGPWEHIFEGERSPRVARVLIDGFHQKLLAMQVQRNRSVSASFTDATQQEMDDVFDSMLNGNDAFGHPEEFDLETVNQPPEWASATVSSDYFYCIHWEHRFPGEKYNRATRLIINKPEALLVALQIQRDIGDLDSYTEASQQELDDVHDSLLNANDAYDNPENCGMLPMYVRPKWAVGKTL